MTNSEKFPSIIERLEEVSSWNVETIRNSLGKIDCERNFTIVDLRKHGDPTFTNRDSIKEVKAYYRVFVEETGSSDHDYHDIGWVLKEEVSHCMICNQAFLEPSSKYNCHACGDVVCSHCRAQRAALDVFPDSELEFPVCDVCCFGQNPVSCVPNRSEGESAVTTSDFIESPMMGEKKVSSLSSHNHQKSHNESNHSIGKMDSIESFFQQPFGWTEEEQTAFPPALLSPPSIPKLPIIPNFSIKNFRALVNLKSRIGLKHYGLFEFNLVQSKLLVKISNTKKIISKRRRQSQKGGYPEEETSCLYVNICASSNVPQDLCATESKEDDEKSISTANTTSNTSNNNTPSHGKDLFCLVFAPLSAKFKEAPVVDVAVNDQLLQQCESEEELRKELLLQILNGISLLFPETDFRQVELVDRVEKFAFIRQILRKGQQYHYLDDPTTSPRGSVIEYQMLLPTKRALLTLRYCYLNITEAILSSKMMQQFSSSGPVSVSAVPSSSSGTATVVSLLKGGEEKLDRSQRNQLETQYRHLLSELLHVQRSKQPFNQHYLLSQTFSRSMSIDPEDSPRRSIRLGRENLNNLSLPMIIPEAESDAFSVPRPKQVSLKIVEGMKRPSLNEDQIRQTSISSTGSLSLVSPSNTNPATQQPKKMQRVGSSSGWIKFSRSGIIVSTRYQGSIDYVPEITGEEYMAITHASAVELKATAINDPTILLGWQVKVSDSDEIFVLTKSAYSLIYGLRYRLTNKEGKKQWKRLQLAPDQPGIPFQLLRKISAPTPPVK